nr:PREDICTED: uncharacterized protein LOC103312918 [Tribolium castaneum]XP_015835542.1 PREDICTED: uncharacterized protein LOC103312918 [Tribolium castaneum]|eukprot:XP_015835541.1 PREDICTED: uncharacterized protein LOC103312918 [Tribolium castaneum]
MNYLGLEVILVCSAKLRRYFPVNCILFLLFTFSVGTTLVSFAVSCTGILWSSIYGTALAVVVLITLSLMSCQKKWEVTNVCMHIFTFLYMSVITGFVTIALNFTHFKECDLWFMFITSAIMQILILWLLYVTRQIAVCEKERLCCQEYVYGALTQIAYLPLFPMSIIKFIKYCRKL